MLLNGNAYVRLAVDGHDRPAELHCMRPERVSVACGADGWPSAYLYRAGGQVVRIARDDALGRRQVAHLKALNPGDDHYDRDRDYQAGQARASSGQAGLRAEHVELPAVLTAGEARQLAEADIARRWRASDRLKLRLPPSRMGLKAGDAIQLADEANVRSITAVSIDGMAVVIETEPAPAAIQSLPADGGRPVSEPDLPIGRSELLLFEAPADGVQPADTPRVWLAASNEGGWKRLPVELDLSDAPLPGTVLGRRAIVGHAETVLDARMPLILDELSTVTVRLINADQILMNADQEALAAGANLAILGDELIQFGRADRLSAGLFRLSKLLRGRRGTEWAADSHSAGEAFCLIDPAALAVVDLDAGAVGAALTATAHGIGDAAPLPQAARVIGGEAMRPPTPCHLQIDRAGNNVAARWVRRSYRNWAWIDGIGDRPDAFPERYRLTLNGSGGETVIETNIASVMIEAAQIPGEAGEPVQLSVATIGAAAVSAPGPRATFTL